MKDVDINHRDGVAWYEHPAPKKRHKHWAQTSGWVGLDAISRCPCGAMERNRDGVWANLDKARVAKAWWRK